MTSLLERWDYLLIVAALVGTFFLKQFAHWLWAFIAVVAAVVAFREWAK